MQDAVSRAGLNLNDTVLPPLRPFGTGPDVIARSFGTSSQVLGEAVLEVKLDAARQKLRERWLLVGLAAAALARCCCWARPRVTRWVLRPVLRLNSAVASWGQRDGRPASRGRSAGTEGAEPLLQRMAHTVSESLESQRQLIADTSHELRNPVGALRLRIDLLRLELQTERQRKAADGVAGEMERVEEILDGVLSWRRPSTGRSRARPGAPPDRARAGR